VVTIRGVLFHIPFHHLPSAFFAVQTAAKLIRPKGRSMRKYKSGLHKDVPAIFEGVWNPEMDNIQQSFGAPAASSVAHFNPEPQVVGRAPEQGRSTGFFRACRGASEYVFRSRARRERRRLSSISKHLMINMPS